MKFIEYDKKYNKSKKTNWIVQFDFDVCHLISEARLRAGLTQDELAKLINTKQPSIARIESGASLPSLGFLKKIAVAIGTTLTPPQFGFMLKTDQPVNIITDVKEEIRYVPFYIEAHKSATKILIN